jgi:hypothetical protein
MNSAGVAATSKAWRCCSFRVIRANQDKIVVHQSLRNGYDKNQTSALAFIVPWNSSAAAANRKGDLIDQFCASMRKRNAVFGQGGVYPFARQHLREKFCRL